MHTLFGIKNCDTVKKARQWLDQNAIAYCFHDFRDLGLTPLHVQHFLAECGWETLLNRRSTTWKSLNAAHPIEVDAESVGLLLLEYPTLIKRPVLDIGDQILVGFSHKQYQSALLPHA